MEPGLGRPMCQRRFPLRDLSDLQPGLRPFDVASLSSRDVPAHLLEVPLDVEGRRILVAADDRLLDQPMLSDVELDALLAVDAVVPQPLP